MNFKRLFKRLLRKVVKQLLKEGLKRHAVDLVDVLEVTNKERSNEEVVGAVRQLIRNHL